MRSVGSVVAGYRVERVLGSGGMGAVYLVANPELPRREALKLLSTELSRDKGFRARFIREADVASQLDHPNIVSIFRRGETEDGQLWIAMQFVDGTDADEALRTGKITPGRAIHIVTEVAKALDYAHGQNVLHRDVKPANFLLSGLVGPDERVLLGDFGIARAFDDASLTGTGEVMATVSYAAPEVIAGDPVDPRTDQYSLGCSLFRLLTGKAPFAGAGGQAAVMMAHLSKSPPPVSEHAPWLPPALDAVFATALAKDPAQRFASCADFATAAKAALHQPIPNRELSTQRIAPSPPRQRHTPPASYTPPGQPTQQHTPLHFPAPPQQYTPPPTQPRRSRRTTIIAATAGVFVIAAASIAVIARPSSESGPAPTASTTAPAITTTRSSTSSPPATVSPAALSDLLLNAGELGSIMGISLRADQIRDAMWDDRDAISDKDCVGAWAPAQLASYDGSRWTDVRAQIVQQQPAPEQDGASVAQAVIAFPTQDLARGPFTSLGTQWKRCEGHTFTVSAANGPANWTFVREDYPTAGLSTMAMSNEGGSNLCGRALTLRDNIVVDVLACRPGLTSEAVNIANRIAAKIPQ